MEEHTLKVIEFGKVIARLQSQAASSLGQEAAAVTYPAADIELARSKQKETTEARTILDYEGSIPFGGIEDIRKYVERASVQAMLQPQDLLSVLGTLQSSRRLGLFFGKLRQKYPLLCDLASEIDHFEKLEAGISNAISSNAEVLDSASPALGRARSELRTVHARLTERINSVLQSKDYRTIIQEPVITIRNDRYCIPIKSEHRGQFPGIVHDASASGATLFMEPASIVEMGNRRKQLAVKEREEVERVLVELSGEVGDLSERIMATLNVVGMLDCIAARAKLSLMQGASEPVLNDQGRIDLRAARHPLLTGSVMPIDVNLGKRFNALLITGPNTGGKTVTLKTLGLFAVMAASGLHIPAASGSEMAIFDDVRADIGDEQSIEQSLSTFSSHMTNIVRITRNASRNSLILLDEIGAGTDPGEGAALAKAVLDYLLGKGAKIVATTHYGELKEFAYLREGIENASVEFDPETLRPTYRLLTGIPGSSNAFAIAGRLGLDGSIIEAAKSNLATHIETTDELIRRIEESHKAAAEQQRMAERSSSDAEALRRRYQEQLSRLENARDRVEQNAKERAESVIQSYSRKLDQTLEQLAHQKKDSKRAQDLSKKAEKLVEQLEDQAVAPVVAREPKDEALSPGTELKRGTRVRIANVNQDAEIVEPPADGKVVVLVGTMRVSVPMSSLRKPRGEPEKEEVRDHSAESRMALEKAREFVSEIHLRGLRVEPALLELERYLDDAMSAGVDQVRIIHGKGTGQMKNAVWDYLRKHPGISSYRLGEPGEGGSGATVAKMK